MVKQLITKGNELFLTPTTLTSHVNNTDYCPPKTNTTKAHINNTTQSSDTEITLVI